MLPIVLLDTQKLSREFNQQLANSIKGAGWEMISYKTTPLENIQERCNGCEIILVNKDVLKEEQFKLLPDLKYVVVVATGYDNVDVIAAKRYGIAVSNIPDYSTETVAQHTIALLLELTNRVGNVSYMVQKQGKWYGIGHTHLELCGLTLGVFGFGKIAQNVIKIAAALGMKIMVASRQQSYTTDLPVTFVDKETLFKNSDVITLHCPLTDATKHLINKDTLALMKPSSLLINASRGGLVNEADLYSALSNKQIQGAALDVLLQEPTAADNPLLTLDNCIITPHNAWSSKASLSRWLHNIIACISSFQKGEFINLVTR